MSIDVNPDINIGTSCSISRKARGDECKGKVILFLTRTVLGEQLGPYEASTWGTPIYWTS